MTFDACELKAVIDRYPPDCRGTPVESTTDRGFSGAVIARVRAAAGVFCLRGWPDNAPPVERIRGLHRLVSFVGRTGVPPVPVPIATDSGETLVAAAGRWWQLEPWMPGVADFRDNPNEARLRNAMATLAAFHRAAAGFQALPAEQPWFECRAAGSPAVQERLAQLRDWQTSVARLSESSLPRLGESCHIELPSLPGQPPAAAGAEFRELAVEIVAYAERVGPSILRQLEAAATLTFELTPCIRDVWHDHLLWTGDAVTGLVDLAACRCESVAADLARLLGSLVGDDARLWDVALHAYQQHRPLSLDELGLVPILDQSGVLLSALKWLERRYLRGEAVDTPRVVERLRALAARLRGMAAHALPSGCGVHNA